MHGPASLSLFLACTRYIYLTCSSLSLTRCLSHSSYESLSTRPPLPFTPSLSFMIALALARCLLSVSLTLVVSLLSLTDSLLQLSALFWFTHSLVLTLMRPMALSLSLFLALTHSLFLSHTRCPSPSLTLSLIPVSVFLPYTDSLSLSLSRSLTHSLSLSVLPPSCTWMLSLTLPCSSLVALSLSLSLFSCSCRCLFSLTHS